MGNKINFEEFILKQYDETLNSKDRLEAKASSYLAVNALILAVLATFISILVDKADSISTKIFHSFVIIDGCVFFLGIANLLICIFLFFPRRLWGFSSEKLLKAYYRNQINDRNLLKESEAFTYQNKKVLDLIRMCYVIISGGLFIQLIGFAVASIYFFIILL